MAPLDTVTHIKPSGGRQRLMRDPYTPTEPSEALVGSIRGQYSHRALWKSRGLDERLSHPAEPSEAPEGSVRGHYSHQALQSSKGLGERPEFSPSSLELERARWKTVTLPSSPLIPWRAWSETATLIETSRAQEVLVGDLYTTPSPVRLSRARSEASTILYSHQAL